MMSGHEVLKRITSGRVVSAGGTLASAFVFFTLLNFIFVLMTGFRLDFTFPAILLIAGINYIPLVFIPFYMWRQMGIGVDFLGLSIMDLRRTIPVCLVVFTIGVLSQPGLLGEWRLASVPDWDVYIFAISIPIVAIAVPLLDMRVSRILRIHAGYITLIIWGVQSYFFPLGDESMAEAMSEATVKPHDLIFLALLIGLYVPLMEEIFFRGFVMKYFSNRFTHNPFFAIFITAMLFGFAHFGSLGVSSLVLFAIPLGMLVYSTKSIYPAVFAHAGLNLSGVLVVWLSSR